MTTLKRYAELGSTHRNEPCQEYPGTWLVYLNGKEMRAVSSLESAQICSMKEINQAEREGLEDYKISICWSANDEDPRYGEVWFSGFYQHGYYNRFGDYRQT